MARDRDENHLSAAAAALSVSARALAKESGVSHSLLVKWMNGERAISPKSKKLLHVAEALLRMDRDGALKTRIAPYRDGEESDAAALLNYLTQNDLPALPPQAGKPARQRSGEYTKEVRVLLGKKGFQKAALMMLDYLTVLPPGQQVIVLCQSRYEWITKDIAFVIQFIAKLRRAVERGARLTMINRRGYTIAETAAFAGPWLNAHLKGYIRSLYYDGEMPEEIRFVASIPGYWSGRAEEDETAEDNLYVCMQTDARDIRQDEMLIDRYVAMSDTVSQYDFFTCPAGNEENPKLWTSGALPPWHGGTLPDGGFVSIASLPGFGLMTRAEYEGALGDAPDLPEYLFSADGAPPDAPTRLILCKEEVREALSRREYEYAPFNQLAGRPVALPRKLLCNMLERLLDAASARDDMEIALMPRIAMKTLNLELVCWTNSASIGWLPDAEKSVFAIDKATSGSFYGYVAYVWDKQLAGWRDKVRVPRQIRKWLRGEDLDATEEYSTIVKNWDAMPRE